MSLSQVNWELYLGSNPRVPYDVYFTFPHGETNDRVGAHRFALAAVSDAFHSMFHGSLPEGNDRDIAIKDTSVVAFTAMRDFIYNKIPDWSKFEKFKLYLDIYKLADRYLIEELKNEVFQSCSKFTITQANFQEVSWCVENYSFFEDLTNMIQKKCAFFIYSTFGSFQKISEFMEKYQLEYGGNRGIFMKIMSMVDINSDLQACYTHNYCTYGYTREAKVDWGYYVCKDCVGYTEKHQICQPCAKTCHEGHEIVGPKLEDKFSCACGEGGNVICKDNN